MIERDNQGNELQKKGKRFYYNTRNTCKFRARKLSLKHLDRGYYGRLKLTAKVQLICCVNNIQVVCNNEAITEVGQKIKLEVMTRHPTVLNSPKNGRSSVYYPSTARITILDGND